MFVKCYTKNKLNMHAQTPVYNKMLATFIHTYDIPVHSMQ